MFLWRYASRFEMFDGDAAYPIMYTLGMCAVIQILTESAIET